MAHALRNVARQVQKATGAKYQACLRVVMDLEPAARAESESGAEMRELIVRRAVKQLGEQKGA